MQSLGQFRYRSRFIIPAFDLHDLPWVVHLNILRPLAGLHIGPGGLARITFHKGPVFITASPRQSLPWEIETRHVGKLVPSARSMKPRWKATSLAEADTSAYYLLAV